MCAGWNGGLGGIVVDVEEFAQAKQLQVTDHVGRESPAERTNGNGAAADSPHTADRIQGGSAEGKVAEAKGRGSRRGLYIFVGLIVLILIVLAVVVAVTRCFGHC
jgi:hypothetical protein